MKRGIIAVGLVAWSMTFELASGSRTPAESFAREGAAGHHSAVFEYEREGLPVPHWKLDLRADGSGTYANLSGTEGMPATPAQPIHIGESIQERLSAAYPVVHSGKCETKLKNIAKTGRKTLTYAGAEEAGTCTFNYSDSEVLNALADDLVAVAATMQAGERIAQKHRYDRLGLDAELDLLTDQVKSGRALEIANIAPTLESVANDERVMERAQRKAARLLQEAGVPSESAR